MSDDDEVNNLRIEIPSTLHKRLKATIPHGTKSQCVRNLLTVLDECMRKNPEILLPLLDDPPQVKLVRK
jgi:hypothetical protein